MARTDDDNWDLTSSVGVTATIVAVGRALATKDPRGLINDPFAEPLVRAVGLDLFTKMMDGELDMSTIADVSPAVAQAMVYGNAVRTKYFDDYLLNATAGGFGKSLSSRQVGLPGLPAAVADQDGGIRDRPTKSDGVQDDNLSRPGRRTLRHPARRAHRLARRLADGITSRRV